MIRSKNKDSWMAWSIRPEVSKIQDIVSETRMYLENFIQELIIEFIFRNGNESRHQRNSNFIVNNEIGK